MSRQFDSIVGEAWTSPGCAETLWLRTVLYGERRLCALRTQPSSSSAYAGTLSRVFQEKQTAVIKVIPARDSRITVCPISRPILDCSSLVECDIDQVIGSMFDGPRAALLVSLTRRSLVELCCLSNVKRLDSQ